MESVESLKQKFKKIGATLKIEVDPKVGMVMRRDQETKKVFLVRGGSPTTVNATKTGFEIRTVDPKIIQVLDVKADDRHLTFISKVEGFSSSLLCGHDERQWFSAEVRNANSVVQAKESLKPTEVVQAQNKAKVRGKDRNKRHNKIFIRQGEWFFMPVEGTPHGIYSKNEPFNRPRGKAHRAEEAIKQGGRTMYVSFGNAITPETYGRLSPSQQRVYTMRTVDSTLYVRGKISHPDHYTVILKGWHKVVGNTEVQTGNSNLFLD